MNRLLAANILDSVPKQLDRIRFAVEAVQDFYRADADVAAILKAPTEMAKAFAKLLFTEAYPRLARIGQVLANEELRNEFVGHLADVDARQAAIVIRAAPERYTPESRQKIVDELGRQIDSRHRVRGAFAINLLSDLRCEEASCCLAAHLLPPAQPHTHLKPIGAIAFIKLGFIAGVELAYKWPWFSSSAAESYYFKEMFALMRGANAEFKTALGDYALRQLYAPSGHHEHIRAIYVMAYLGDERLASHLNDRLAENGSLLEYENHALIALGTTEAGNVFLKSAIGIADKISNLGSDDHGKARFFLHSQISANTADYGYLCSPAFDGCVTELIRSDNGGAVELGYSLAMQLRTATLIHEAILAVARWKWSMFRRNEGSETIPPETWVQWWTEAADVRTQQTLLRYLPASPIAEIEQILIDCLYSSDLRGHAIRPLGTFGCYRAAPHLRQLFRDESDDVDLWDKGEAASALGMLRDEASIESLQCLAESYPMKDLGLFAVSSLGFIGTKEAENALCKLLETGVDEQFVVKALICCGSPSAMSKVLEIARSKVDGTEWLCVCLRRAFWNRGYQRGRFYTHISTAALVDFLASTEDVSADKWNLLHCFEQIDSEEVRGLLRRWAGCQSTAADPLIRENDKMRMSFLCYDELLKRGDSFAVRYFLDYRSGEKDSIYVRLASDNLSHFPSAAVATELRNRLLASTLDNSWKARFLSLLGRFGDKTDEELIHPFLDHPDDLVANVACESLLRLTDPMLVPEKWRTL